MVPSLNLCHIQKHDISYGIIIGDHCISVWIYYNNNQGNLMYYILRAQVTNIYREHHQKIKETKKRKFNKQAYIIIIHDNL